MEIALRAALLDWLRADPALTGALNIVAEETPREAVPPWLGIAASASSDWSTKTETGRDIRVALELHLRGDDPAAGASIVKAIEARIAAFPAAQDGFWITASHFLRARTEARPRNTRATLLEYRFRCLAPLSGDHP